MTEICMGEKTGRFRISSVIVKIIAVNVLSLLICTAGLSVFNYRSFRADSVQIYANRALSAAETAAALVDGDNLSALVKSGTKNETWRREKRFVDDVLERLDLAYLYILGSDYGKEVVYYLEARTEKSHIDLRGTDAVSNYAKEMFETVKTGMPFTTGIYDSGDYGMLVSGFVAIKDRKGDVVGVVGADIAADEIFDTMRVLEFVFRQFFTFLICSILPIVFQVFLFRRMIGRPIKELTVASARLGGGDLEVSLAIDTGDEIEKLSKAFVKMATQLKDYIENLTRVTAEKERIGAELDVANKIQASMLPCLFPPFPNRAEFDIYATMQPAKEVGGDFYDFFLIDNNTLAVVIADVSGKGVPAALFMVIAKTLIKNNAQYGKNPKEVLETVNNLLCENNEASMFVTVFMGYLDIPSGRFTFVNAGHNPPLIRSGGRLELLKEKPGFVLAGMEGTVYRQREIVLRPGDELFLYTDGVTEAMNKNGELFGEPRLIEMVGSHSDLPLCEFTTTVERRIDEFADGEEQADDITMLALRYKGPGGKTD